MDAEKVMASVGAALEQAREFGLETEVVAFAMMELKSNPVATIDAALSAGLMEFDAT